MEYQKVSHQFPGRTVPFKDTKTIAPLCPWQQEGCALWPPEPQLTVLYLLGPKLCLFAPRLPACPTLPIKLISFPAAPPTPHVLAGTTKSKRGAASVPLFLPIYLHKNSVQNLHQRWTPTWTILFLISFHLTLSNWAGDMLTIRLNFCSH